MLESLHHLNKVVWMSSNEGLLIYNLYYIVNGGLQVFKFKIRGYKMCTAFLMKISTNSYRTIIKNIVYDLQVSYTKQMIDKTWE